MRKSFKENDLRKILWYPYCRFRVCFDNKDSIIVVSDNKTTIFYPYCRFRVYSDNKDSIIKKNLRPTTLWSIRKVTALSLCGTPERGFSSGKSSLNGSDSHIHFIVLYKPECLLGAGEKNKKGTCIKMTLS